MGAALVTVMLNYGGVRVFCDSAAPITLLVLCVGLCAGCGPGRSRAKGSMLGNGLLWCCVLSEEMLLCMPVSQPVNRFCYSGSATEE